jgi:branched-chain amino acid transport system permease protein
LGFIDPTSFTIPESLMILLMVILGGMGTLKGPMVGAFILVTAPEVLRFLELPASAAAPLRQIAYGLLLVFLVVLRPRGIIGEYSWR